MNPKCLNCLILMSIKQNYYQVKIIKYINININLLLITSWLSF